MSCLLTANWKTSAVLIWFHLISVYNYYKERWQSKVKCLSYNSLWLIIRINQIGDVTFLSICHFGPFFNSQYVCLFLQQPINMWWLRQKAGSSQRPRHISLKPKFNTMYGQKGRDKWLQRQEAKHETSNDFLLCQEATTKNQNGWERRKGEKEKFNKRLPCLFNFQTMTNDCI